MDYGQVKEAAAFLQNKYTGRPKIGLILGSGLGILGEEIKQSVRVPYKEIPHFPVSTVAGHAGQLVFGFLSGKEVVAMQGRFHYYEGYQMGQVAFPVRVMKELGVEVLIVTNAAGGVNEKLKPGQLMLISDHINLMGTNPLIGPNDAEFGVRFPDMSAAYDPELRQLAKQIADELQIDVQEGVYAAFTGPSYETPAEIRMVRAIGGDAVGMSTVPEVITARHAGLKVLGISCITNMAAGILDVPLNHEEVVKTANRVREDFLSYVKEITGRLKVGQPNENG
ncbi:purine nucleoside phosphorylase [Weizmannia acidilactici]|uniref:Purine nucleoside phosphorylase n=1 Tax=Weizmannia acidilactici TaxID=2607726 RepID=A0A5J4JBJ8_9BACI|nr:purine-nucleoside phosphorylase [Weizmannia acidilactici]GER66082.1 purine nucleoside phosphorylase [Weizmannia acidilactici]GER69283.1 purine nucleoside phosphorylase [Weizmannia acidilactici]GER72391.1 purine nucleoside phosphorylase [Weizmannia acidilactici]